MKPYEENPRYITEPEAERLREDLARFGDLSGVVHDLNTDRINGGHQRLRVLFGERAGEFAVDEANIELIKEFDAPDAQGTVGLGYLVWRGFSYAYRQVRWDEDTFFKANIAANRDGGFWDSDVLARLDPVDLRDRGLGDDYLTELQAANQRVLDLFEVPTGTGDDQEAPEAREDEADELLEKWGVKPGQVWQLGAHRLICGDSEDPAVIERLMQGEGLIFGLHDPPYGIDIMTDYGFGARGDRAVNGKTFKPVAGNEKSFDPSPLASAFDYVILWGANHYAPRLPHNGRWLIWDKREDVIPERTQADCELAWCSEYGAARIFRHYWDGMIKASEQGEARQHPTQKPVALMEWCIGFGPEDAPVCDFYAGSGPTLIACERLGRPCRAAELDPHYVAVIIQRWVDATAGDPALVEG
jgi:site-specific DNA-methyltransferase (adenine-specific)/modification methylase